MPTARAEGIVTGDEASTLDLDVHAGDVILLRGPNGSGKTSLLRALAGLDAALAPRRVERAPTTTVGFSMQDPRGALVGLTVAGEMRARGRRATPAHLAPLAERDIATLSSGEARRVSLAVAEGAALTLLDEPSEGLDADGRARLVALVRAARNTGRAVVAADHGGLLDALATRTVELAPRGAAAPLPAIPRPPGGGTVLAAPAARVRHLAFPALELPAGFHAVVGQNGSGKTTWLRHLAGLDEPAGPARPFAPADARTTFARASASEEVARSDARVVDLLVGQHLRARHPLTLSGGEAQRVSLAKALGRPGADIVLLDEPEAHLDAPGRAALVEAIALRVRDGACVLAATHDAQVAALAHRTIALEAPL